MKDKGDAGVKELDSLKSDRLRTIQLNVCNSEEIEKAVETIRSSLKDPEKGKATMRLQASTVSLLYGSCSMLPSICWQPGKRLLSLLLNSSSCSVRGSGLS